MSDHRLYLSTRGLRAVVDGMVATSLSVGLAARGLDDRALGVLVSAALLGSAAMMAVAGRRPDVLGPRRILIAGAALMVLTGTVFSLSGNLVLLVALAVIGPLNPTGGDVSPMLPAEQAWIAERTAPADRSRAYARFAVVGFAGAALGSALAGPIGALGRDLGWESSAGVGLVCALYAAVGLVLVGLYCAGLPPAPRSGPSAHQPLRESREVVHRLAWLFALDSAGGGFVGTALVAAYLSRRFGFDLGQLGLVFAAATVASAVSSLAAPRLTLRFGLVETMVGTHLPANVLCIAAGLAPTAGWAVGLLIARALLSQLDVPPRQTLVMSLVPEHERAAAAAVTNLPRSLAAAGSPVLAGLLLHTSTTGWLLVIGGALKIVYDVLLLVRFRSVSQRI